MIDVKDVQRRLAEIGYDPGPVDGVAGPRTRRAVVAFQLAHGLAADGIVGPITLRTLFPIPEAEPDTELGLLPSSWLDDSRIDRIIAHWTGGRHYPNGFDLRPYHFLIDGNARVHRGKCNPSQNAPVRPEAAYAAHTRGANSYALGVSMCGMVGAKQNPFDPGPEPINRMQWLTMIHVVARCARHYRIDVQRETVLSHAEVEQTLGIKQAGKWDFTRLPFMPNVRGARAIGDMMRGEVRATLRGM